MRDVLAALVALALLFFALRLATTLTRDRRKRAGSEREAIAASGRTILAEIPSNTGLLFFTEDAETFHLGERPYPEDGHQGRARADKRRPDCRCRQPRSPGTRPRSRARCVQQRPEGLSRDQWDVAIDTGDDTVLVPCGRQSASRFPQELARNIFDAVKRTIEVRR